MRIKIIGTPNKKAFGGDLQTQGATWDTGITYVGNGGSHESNPYDGVQIGVDPQGIPNLVEEGEVLWNDFVFSKRIKMPKKDKKLFKLGGDKPISYADAALKLSEYSKERPNDPIGQAGLDKMLTMLSESQETLKAKREQQRARQQFNQMSPEEQMNIMQMAQQQQMMPQTPQDPSMAMMDNPYGNMTACGGKLYATGGYGIYDPDEYRVLNLAAAISPLAGTATGTPAPTQAPVATGTPAPTSTGTPAPATTLGTTPVSRREARRAARAARPAMGDENWFKAKGKTFGVDMSNFTYDADDRAGNLARFNELYAQSQRQKAYDTYLAGQRKDWVNQELAAGRYKRGDDGNGIYKAQFYGDADLGKDYISANGTRITADEYARQQADYNTLMAKKKRTAEEQARVDAFNNASYKKSPVAKGQFVKDYNGNIVYDYNQDVSDSWVPSDDVLGKDFKWDPKNAAQISYDPENRHSAASYLRYVPAIGGAIGLMTDAFSKPDYSRAQEIKDAGAYDASLIDYKPIGNYLRYSPMDINYEQNRLNQEAAATRRAIQNTAGTRGAAMAGILASDYNAQQASGDLYRKALEYNDALEQKVEDFNRGTNMFNSQNDLTVKRANQATLTQAKRDAYQGVVAGNTLMDTIDARRNVGMNADLTNLLTSLGQMGEEAYDQDRIDALIRRGVLKDVYQNSSAHGGMLTKSKRKKGGRR